MNLGDKTIADFGHQWTKYSDTSGFFGSVQLLGDFVQPFDVAEFRGKRVADIGSGTGRFVIALLDAGAEHVVAVEPSRAVDVIREKLSGYDARRVTILEAAGERLPPDADLDYVISIGVVHHIPDPRLVIAAAYAALRPGGKLIVWLYGREGNEAYLLVMGPLRRLSRWLPKSALAALAWALNVLGAPYVALCTAFPDSGLPLSGYLAAIFAKLPFKKRQLVIYDQLNPEYAKYYTKSDAQQLLSGTPFVSEVFQRRGYSWVVIGTKPPAEA